MIREQYGENPHWSFAKARALEKEASSRRKLQTLLDFKFRERTSSLKDLISNLKRHETELDTLQGARKFLPYLEWFSTDADPHIKKEAMHFKRIFESFCKQSSFDNLLDFLKDQKYAQRNRINLLFLNRLGINPVAFYNENVHQIETLTPWEKLSTIEKAFYLDSFAFRATYQKCYQLPESDWNPSKPISHLIAQIKERGPHYIKGMFGKSYYQDPPKPMKEKIQGRTLWYWPENADRIDLPESHSIVIVGAAEGESRGGLVYFVDPQDGSDPADPEKQKIYVMSYNRLRSSIVNLHHEQLFSDAHTPIFSDKVGYALVRRPSKAQ